MPFFGEILEWQLNLNLGPVEPVASVEFSFLELFLNISPWGPACLVCRNTYLNGKNPTKRHTIWNGTSTRGMTTPCLGCRFVEEMPLEDANNNLQALLVFWIVLPPPPFVFYPATACSSSSRASWSLAAHSPLLAATVSQLKVAGSALPSPSVPCLPLAPSIILMNSHRQCQTAQTHFIQPKQSSLGKLQVSATLLLLFAVWGGNESFSC